MAEIRFRRHRAVIMVEFSTRSYAGPSEDFAGEHALDLLLRGVGRADDLGTDVSRPTAIVARELRREPLSVYDVPCLVCDAVTGQACTEYNGELRNVPHPTRPDHLALRRRLEGWES